MIKIVAQFFIKENEIENVLELCKPLVEETRKEAGCIKYEACQNNNDKNHLVILEEWENQEYLDMHSNSDHFKKYVPQIVALSENKITNFFTQVI